MNKYIPLPGSAHPDIPMSRIHSALAPQKKIEVHLHLRSRRTLPDTEPLAVQLPHQRKYLTVKEFERRYGARPGDIAKVKTFAAQNGLTVKSIATAEAVVILAGTVLNISRAFGVHLFNFTSGGELFLGHQGPVHIPSSLKSAVEGVFGLDDRPFARPHYKLFQPQAGSSPYIATYLPTQVADIYNFPKATGKDQTIAIIELGGGYYPSVLETYFKNYIKLKEPPNVSAIGVQSGFNNPGHSIDFDNEVYLDIEMAGAIAPEAEILVYFGPQKANQAPGYALLQTANAAVFDKHHNLDILSISWGSPELWGKDLENIPVEQRPAYQQYIKAFEKTLKSASLMGITVCVSSGDQGSFGTKEFIGNHPNPLFDFKAHAEFPASCPHALACGGTRLIVAGKKIKEEITWNDGIAMNGSSGGGISYYFKKPAYQSKASVPVSVNPAGHVGRGLPDLAGNADPFTGYTFLLGEEFKDKKVAPSGKGGSLETVHNVLGGTSAVAPLYAGLMARINQLLGSNAGQIHQHIYDNPAIFRDITQGDNFAYDAGKGWDACTGLGVVDGTKLLNILKDKKGS